MKLGIEKTKAADERFTAFSRNPLRPLIKKMAARIAEEYQPAEIILYGSQATGNARPDSDIDFFVVKETNDSFITRCAAVKRSVRDLRRDVPFSPIVLTPEEVQRRLDRGDQFIEEIVETGIRL